MTTPETEFEQELARLSAAFVDRLELQVQAIGDSLNAWLGTPDDPELYERLSHEVHQLKGAGSTFGCPQISDAARTLERRLAECRAVYSGTAELVSEDVMTAMQRLQDEAAAAHDSRAPAAETMVSI